MTGQAGGGGGGGEARPMTSVSGYLPPYHTFSTRFAALVLVTIRLNIH